VVAARTDIPEAAKTVAATPKRSAHPRYRPDLTEQDITTSLPLTLMDEGGGAEVVNRP
jgi:hypothetical protein